jgi:hypothetical protein
MTAARGKVSASLASRGRPEDWATESEAAALSGMSPQDFSWKLPYLESVGFPKKSPWNDKRFIPAIEKFWWNEPACNLPKAAGAEQDNAPLREKFDGRATKYARLGKFIGL